FPPLYRNIPRPPTSTPFPYTTLFRSFQRHHTRQLDDAGLGAGIAHLRRSRPADTRGRGHVDDGAAALPLHQRQNVAATQVDALQVEVDLLIPRIFIQVRRAALAGTAHVVDQDIHPPPPVGTRAHQVPHRVRVGHVGLPGGDLAPDFAYARHRFFHGVCVHVHGEYARAFLREPIGDR